MKFHSSREISPLARSGIALFVAMVSAPAAAHLPISDSPISHRLSVEPNCDVKFIDPYSGRTEKKPLPNANRLKGSPLASSALEDLKINWICISSNDDRVGFHGISILNSRTGKWTLDWSRIIGNSSTTREEQWQYRWYRANYKEVQLKSVNSQGYAIVDRTQTGDGTIPAESDKHAQGIGPILFSFCLIRPPKALCGDGHVGQKEDGIKGDLTPYALKLIRSIEFID